MEKQLKLSKKQKWVIKAMREGYILYENAVTTGARWCLVHKNFDSFSWGNVNGNIVKGITELLNKEKYNIAIYKYQLTELGKSIEL